MNGISITPKKNQPTEGAIGFKGIAVVGKRRQFSEAEFGFKGIAIQAKRGGMAIKLVRYRLYKEYVALTYSIFSQINKNPNGVGFYVGIYNSDSSNFCPFDITLNCSWSLVSGGVTNNYSQAFTIPAGSNSLSFSQVMANVTKATFTINSVNPNTVVFNSQLEANY